MYVKRVRVKMRVRCPLTYLGKTKKRSMLLMGTIVHFSVFMHQPPTPQTPFQRLGYFTTLCNSLGLPSSTRRPTWGIGPKSPPLSSSPSLMATPLQVPDTEQLGSLAIGEHDLLIVGPGVLGRLVADKWREVTFRLLIYLYPS